jgi:general secretion pathway protein E
MAAPYLEISTPQGKRQVPLGAQPLTIGRHADNKLVLADHMASRFHCVIEPKGSGWVVRDLNSSNGTFMAGKRITMQPLQPGHPIQIGETRMIVIDPSAKPAPVPQDDDEIMELGDDAEVIEDFEEVDEYFEEDEVPAPVEDDALIEVEADPDPQDGYASDNGSSSRSRGGGSSDHTLVHDDPDSARGGEVGQFEQRLEALAESLPDKPFGEHEIAMISARGQVMHAAGKEAGKDGAKKKKREAVDVLRILLLICTRGRATDIHLEPKTDHFQLRVRIDGVMVDVTKLPMDVGIKLSALVKVLSDIDISQRTTMQEGHFASKVPGAQGGKSGGFRRADYRVSFAPAVFGQKLVVRIFDAANAPLKIDNLQLPDWMLEAVKHELQKEAGMVLVCGPTGSGKTTTLYSLVRSSDLGRRNVVTIEDPVEVQLEGVTQIQVDEAQGKTFSTLLRSVLRQDPDAILVGEIRDSETARTAMQAAITGHLVFSTVHTTNTIGSIFRMLDLGVEPYLVAQGLHVVIAQRLVRQLCQYCRTPVKVTPRDLEKMGEAGKGVTQIYNPRGCSRCLGTGFAGRRAFFELLRTTDELRDVIITSRTMEDIKKVLAKDHFVRLEQSGYQLVADGLVSLDEIDAAVGK